MNGAVKALIALVLFIVLIAGAYFLYNYLSSKQEGADDITTSSTTEASAETTTEKGTSQTDASSGVTEKETTDTKSTETTSKPTLTAPDFTVTDYNGNKVKLSDFAGKPIVINFWASWCEPCKSELPGFDSVYNEYKDEVVFLMVNLTDGGRDTVAKVKIFVKSGGYTFPVYFDTTGGAAGAYGIYSIPETVFIGKDGSVYKRQLGAMTEYQLITYIKGITGENK